MSTTSTNLGAGPFGAYEVCELAGITYRQLDHWDRSGYLKPSIEQADGGGSRRLYSVADLKKARLTRQLLDVGIPLETIRADGDPRRTAKRLSVALAKLVPA